MTSLASTLSDSNKIMSNSTSSETKPTTTLSNFAPASVLSVSDLESQYDSILADDDKTDTAANISKDPVDFWASTSGHSNAEWNRGNPVVVIRGAAKSYGSKKCPNIVLDKLNLTIREGSM